MNGEPQTMMDVLRAVKHARVYIAGGMLLGGVVALLFLAFATPFYKAQMITGPASPISDTQSEIKSSSSQPGATEFMRFEYTLAGPAVAQALLKDERIYKGLTYEPKRGLFGHVTEWNPQQLADYIKRRVRVEPVGETPLRRLVYYHPSAEFAVYFLDQLHRTTDKMIRARIRSETTGRVDYLEKTIAQNPDPDHRRALTALLMEEERRLMLVTIDQPFAAIVVEPPASSFKPKWPDCALVAFGLLLAGAIAGFVVHGLRRCLKSRLRL